MKRPALLLSVTALLAAAASALANDSFAFASPGEIRFVKSRVPASLEA